MYTTYKKSLFSAKELFIMSHDANGKSTCLQEDYARSPMYRYENMHLSDYMPVTDYHGIEIPVMHAYTNTTDLEFYSYAQAHRLDGKGQAIHFFMPDDRFVPSIWKNLDESTLKLTKFDALFTPDFSMYHDRMSFYSLEAVFRKQFVGARWQMWGFNVIPTFSISNVDSLDFCLTGLPCRSVLGVSAQGFNSCAGKRELFNILLREVEDRLSPLQFIIYGSDVTLKGITTPIKYIPDYISTHFRNGKD